MRGLAYLLMVGLLQCWTGNASAQTVLQQHEILAADRPEAWAMNYFAATSLMTSFGESPALPPGRWEVAAELGHIPRLSDAQRRVGFNGFKNEDLNKSPVIGRLRLWLGLPAGWIAEVGYTPPLSIDGARPRDLVALAIGRRVFARGGYTLSARAFGQHGRVQGDITCPDDIAGVADSTRNLYGCQAPSDDRIALNYYGVDLTSAWTTGPWHWHAGLGMARTELDVQVDALTYDVHDRSRLTARDALPFFVLGTSRDLGTHWSVGMEILHVPLTVRRDPDASRERDPLTSLRLQLRYRTR